LDLEEPGLRKRIERESRRISAQHRQLDLFFQAVVTALESNERNEARAHFTRLADALDAHFAIEEELTFPAIRGLRSALGPTLVGLAEEHDALRERVASGREALASHNTRAAEVLEVLEALAEALTAHERREEEILAEILAGGHS
jgi:iron-sulfur cluster repair protein YtfE (RIC family)